MPKQLSGWALQAKVHWKKYRPKMYPEMEKAGTLDDMAQNAASRASDQYATSVENGMEPFEAQSEATRNHLFLPTEEDVPLLGETPKDYV